MGDRTVWEQTADDGEFRCWVDDDGKDGYSGVLQVSVVATGDVIHTEPVGIAYAARFGPDISDVSAWQAKSIEAIDRWIAEHEAES